VGVGDYPMTLLTSSAIVSQITQDHSMASIEPGNQESANPKSEISPKYKRRHLIVTGWKITHSLCFGHSCSAFSCAILLFTFSLY